VLALQDSLEIQALFYLIWNTLQ